MSVHGRGVKYERFPGLKVETGIFGSQISVDQRRLHAPSLACERAENSGNDVLGEVSKDGLVLWIRAIHLKLSFESVCEKSGVERASIVLPSSGLRIGSLKCNHLKAELVGR